MNTNLFFFIALTYLCPWTPTSDRIQIKIPTVEEETNYVWRTIIDTKFFEQYNYQVAHTLKERIIDQLVLINFEKYLPSYRLQGFGDARIGQYLTTKKDIKKLDAIVEQFQKEHAK